MYILLFYFHVVQVIYYLHLTKINVYLFLFHIPKFMINKESGDLWWFLSGDFCVLYNVLLWNVSFSGWHFPAFYGLYQKKYSCCHPWCQPLVNIGLICQFWENVSSFNFLANALFWQQNLLVWTVALHMCYRRLTLRSNTTEVLMQNAIYFLEQISNFKIFTLFIASTSVGDKCSTSMHPSISTGPTWPIFFQLWCLFQFFRQNSYCWIWHLF